MSRELDMETRSLESERRMDKLALKGEQWSISEKLNGPMGKDMREVLEGKRQVKFTRWQRIKNWFDKVLWHLNLVQET